MAQRGRPGRTARIHPAAPAERKAQAPAPAAGRRCLGVTAQLASLHRTLRHGAVGTMAPSAPVNRTGLPEALKDGVEALSGLAMDDVRVHRDSPRPTALGALAYAQGTDIHLAPGQEAHLPHEAWHVVQQKQGRVHATARAGDTPINDEASLEREADLMGARAAGTARPSGREPAAAGTTAAGALPTQWVAAPVLQLASRTDLVAWSDAHAATAGFADDGVAADFQKVLIAGQQVGAAAADLEFHIHLPLSGRAQDGYAGSLFEKGKRNEGSVTSQDSGALNQLVAAWKGTKGQNEVIDTPEHLRHEAELAQIRQARQTLATLRQQYAAVGGLEAGNLDGEALVTAAYAAQGENAPQGGMLRLELRIIARDGRQAFLTGLRERLSQRYDQILQTAGIREVPIGG